jgi:hypothetical protein
LQSFSIRAEITEESLEKDIDNLGAEVDSLARDISLLERELLFPPLTRVQFYVSISADVQFTLQSLSLLLDGEEKSFHIYSASDLAALRLGGVQRLWEGNAAMGTHNVQVKVAGVDRNDRELEKSLSLSFDKKNGGHSLELKVIADKETKSALFSVKDWGEN